MKASTEYFAAIVLYIGVTRRRRAQQRRRGRLTRATMQPNGYGDGRRLNASYVVESELEHLERAMRQPMMRRLNAGYWRRRVLEVQCGYELTEQQGARIERMLQQLANCPS
jgi:hypothetical protein